MDFTDFPKKYFPYSFRAKDAKSLVITLPVHVPIGIVAGFLIRIPANIPVVSLPVGLLGGPADLYVPVGAVLAVLYYIKVVE